MKFNAQIKNISTKNLVSGDTSTNITLQKDNLDPAFVNYLNTLMIQVDNKSQELVVDIDIRRENGQA